MNDWRDSYDAWKLASPYDEGGPSYESVEDLEREMEALLDENDTLKAALRQAERYVSYFAGLSVNHFEGGATPQALLAQVHEALGIRPPSTEEEIAF